MGVPLCVGEYAIALQTTPLLSLEDISKRLIAAQIKHKRIYESDGLYAGQFMSIGCVPCERDKIRRLLSDLPSAK